MNVPLLVIDEDFMVEMTAISPEFNKTKVAFDKLVHDRNQRQFIIFLALLNKRINSIMSTLEKLEDIEEKNLKKLTGRDASIELDLRLKELNSEYTKSLNEFRSIGQDLLSSEYYQNVLKYSFVSETSKYLSAKIYNKFNTKIPQRMTQMSDGYDVYLPQDVVLHKHSTVIVNTGLIIEPPEGYHIELQIRSSFAKHGVFMPVGVGIIDSDYCGPEDYIQMALLYCGMEESYQLFAGERVAQIRFISNTPRVEFLEVKQTELNKPTRGGFGITN